MKEKRRTFLRVAINDVWQLKIKKVGQPLMQSSQFQIMLAKNANMHFTRL